MPMLCHLIDGCFIIRNGLAMKLSENLESNSRSGAKLNIKLQEVMFSLHALNGNKSFALSTAYVLKEITSSCFIVYSPIISKTYSPYIIAYVWTSIFLKFILQPHGLYEIWK
ncbi:hypothetical protein AMTRI_Chr01g111060 [Amborella trichopoda]